MDAWGDHNFGDNSSLLSMRDGQEVFRKHFLFNK